MVSDRQARERLVRNYMVARWEHEDNNGWKYVVQSYAEVFDLTWMEAFHEIQSESTRMGCDI